MIANGNAASHRVAQWLSEFDDALSRSDAAAAAALFAEESFWRDLVAFTWNIATVEGRPAIQAMLEETVARVKPRNWRLDG